MYSLAFSSGSASAFATKLEAVAKNAERVFMARRLEVITALTKYMAALTPVWEGDTLANWRWSISSPNGKLQAPIDNGEPGATNSMPLGPEPRRAANEAFIINSLAEISGYEGWDDLFLSNPSEGAAPLEYGLWPGGPGQQSRSPNGIVRLAIKQAFGVLRSA